MAEKGKKAKHEEAEAGGIYGELVASVEKLQEIQDELDKINEEEREMVMEVDRECSKLCRPVYGRRNDILQSIPDFWLTAFLNHPALGKLLSEKDKKIFKHLVSLDVEDFKDSYSGYMITFNFSANPYFKDTKLTKTYSFDKGMMGTTIKWKEEGMNIANGVARMKKGSKRPHAEESFFSWFDVSQQEDLSEGNFDEVALIIKEDLWPNPLIYFKNEVDEEDFDEDDDCDDDDEEDEDDEEKQMDGDGDENEDDDEDND